MLPHRDEMAKDPKKNISTAEGVVLGQLSHFRYDWLKQMSIILLHSNWPGQARGWSGLQFSILEQAWTSPRPCL